MSRRWLIAATLVTGLAAPPTTSADPGALSIRVTPTTALAPASLSIRLLIDRNADNRWFRITVESDDYFRSSDEGLDDQSPRLYMMTLRDLPAGEYELRAEVFGERGRVRTSARASASIVGGGG